MQTGDANRSLAHAAHAFQATRLSHATNWELNVLQPHINGYYNATQKLMCQIWLIEYVNLKKAYKDNPERLAQIVHW